jgi:photosystem II stability/assembly factor-like uncharacterized protein
MALLRFRFLCLLAVLLVETGTRALGSNWEATGPYGGHALKIVIDPADSNRLYAATKIGQVYKSDDAGQSWQILPFALNAPAASLSAFIVNPASPNELFLGVARSYVSDAPGEAGVYKSADAGLHWTSLGSTTGWSVRSLAVHPAETHIVIAGTEDGVFRSDDAGMTWQRISPANHPHIKAVVSLAMDPSSTRIIYAGTTHLPWKTSDGGLTWQSIHEGMADDSDVFSIAVNYTDFQAVLIGACSGIYRSPSGGSRWSGTPGIPEASQRTHQIVQDPVNPRTFYAATAHGLWKSIDGGVIWKQPGPYPYIVNSVAVDPQSPETIYLATDRSGLLKSIDGGATFLEINQGFVNRNIGRLVGADALHLTSVYEGDFGGVFTTYDRGLTWVLSANQQALHGKNVISLAASPRSPEQLIAGTYDGLLRSSDGGRTWRTVDAFSKTEAANGKIHDVSFSNANPNTIFVATDHGLFRSVNGGLSWRKNSAVEPNTAVYKVSLHSLDSRLMMLRTSRGVLISRNEGIAWVRLNLGEATTVYDAAFSDTLQGRMFVGTSRGLLYSADGGRSWNRGGKGLPLIRVDQILSVRSRPQEMYVLSRERHQVWRSVNGGLDWQEVDRRGLEGMPLLFMAVAGEQPFVVTENNGVFRLNTQSDALQVSRQDLP